MALSIDKIGTALWRWVVGSISALAILVGAIVWANSVHNTATLALKTGEENKARIEALTQQMNAQNNSLIELRVDTRYLIASVQELKDDLKQDAK